MTDDLFRAAFESLPEPALLVSEDGVILEPNPEARWLLDYPKGALRGRPLADILDADAAAAAPREAWKRPGGRFRITATGARRLGSAVPLVITGAAMSDPVHHATLLLLRDSRVTPEMEGVGDEASRFRIVFDGASVGLVFQGPPGDSFLRVNKAYAAMLGYAPGELYTKTIDDLTHPDDRAASHELLRSVYNGDAPDGAYMEKRYFHRDGDVVWCRVSVTLARTTQGDPWFMFAVVEDINKQKRAEGKLLEAMETQRRHSRRLSAVLASLPDGLLILDKDRNVEEINQHLSAICPVMEALRVGTPLDRQPDAMPPDLRAVIEEKARLRESVFGYQFSCRVLGGNVKLLSVNASPIDEQGQGGMVFLIRDMGVIESDSAGTSPVLSAGEFLQHANQDYGPAETPEEAERRAIESMLLRTDGNKAKAARLLGMGRTTLYRKMEQHGLASTTVTSSG